MALGKYSRVDGRKSSSYCSTVTLVVFVALCLVGVWMMTSSSVVPVQNVEVSSQENKNEVKERLRESTESTEENTSSESNGSNESNTKQFEDNPGDLPEDATKGDGIANSAEEENNSNSQENTNVPDKTTKNAMEGDGNQEKPENKQEKKEDGDSETEEIDSEAGEKKKDGDGSAQGDSEEGSNGYKSDSDEGEKRSEEKSGETEDGDKTEGQLKEKVEQKQGKKEGDGQVKGNASDEVLPSGAQSELLNETVTQNGAFSTQATESKNEKEVHKYEEQTGYSWKLCNVTAGSDYIPCLDNLQAIRRLRTTKHYEHRERHCPENPPTCLVPLPEGYQRPIEWPTSREKVYLCN